MNSLNLVHYKEFIENNPQYNSLIKNRMQSYWNEYYRENNLFDLYSSNYDLIAKLMYAKKDYVGFKILDIFDIIIISINLIIFISLT